jgi:protein TonB
MAALAGGGWYLHARSAAAASAAPSEDGSGVGILLDLAATAVRENRLIAPAGSNVYEFGLSVLQLDPHNQKAQDTLRDLFPAASAEVERTINALQLDEAQRELRLLREYDSTNYTLSLLGGKLDAQRQVMIRQDEERAALIQAQSSANAKPNG